MKSCVAAAVFLSLAGSSLAFLFGTGPAHASCKAQWTVGMACSQVETALLNQIQTWSGPENCKSGPINEKCLYVLKSNSEGVIKLTHETPLKHYIDDVSFTLKSQGDASCQLGGYSTAETWYAVLDQGTNYCNMFNLLEGASLTTAAGYTETASDASCTQRSSADCNRY
ncbi:uncharacterized protein LOC110442542 [Mizuhopecten yessoensis]|uniref:Uncharacterized protein n=1 Tax=Mizuhopecten yessoensis TaxID=6573 RepID=A0A210PH58_MIZYE|nr:uncharacterized protein LOC110442542 [Mizuhopecten yessoensis]OWF35756.1 hypothetical protein KP79_PYT19159 [Mizuhopecten yessoensis]